MYIKLRVKAGAKEEKFVQKTKDHFEVSVRELAERNLANKRIVELVARHFKLPIGKVRIISGHHSPSKILNVDVGD